ncbi:LPS export ABC transporter periplasmic protein LptC [Mesonia aestuariivivens]|uniref:LPS export ABC transporter periplasmic protein LptC n=1 Tax=Mesonia aestuariivivens TaxID=2796128 RepID=A0ABS6VXX5_9FLAO|nr:LPS export ABC transporter periplasmic protein LptC [Mesonia aestuariivivens]MBW2960430.1 LPS export ABC transporter periplasmic protein LptC [Mesonia aestuariivivens]
MYITYHHILKGIVALVFATMLFSCQNGLNEARKFDVDYQAPLTVGEGINLFYTDSGKVRANLRSPKMLDFTNLQFPYREFPDGVEVDFFNEKQEKTNIIADYGIIYNTTNLIDLRGNVKIVTADSTILNAKQLYWDQSNSWIFSDEKYNIQMTNGALNDGEGFDANENFDKFISRSNVGVQYIDESEK